jgi:putative ABC transport system ATP-binding protein
MKGKSISNNKEYFYNYDIRFYLKKWRKFYMNIIDIKNLSKTYNGLKSKVSVTAVNNVSFQIEESDFIGIMGPSGSGKTTLLNIISGIDKATSGEISVSDTDINKMNKDELALFRRKNLGYIFQDFNLLDSLTFKENIALPVILDKVKPDKIEKKIGEIAKILNLEKLLGKYPYETSGGEKQRCASARALINNPKVIFADELTGNLDSKSSLKVMELIAKINKELKSTILMVTHDPFAASFCRRIIYLKDGKVKLEIISNGDRKKFFDRIIEVQSVIGGDE